MISSLMTGDRTVENGNKLGASQSNMKEQTMKQLTLDFSNARPGEIKELPRGVNIEDVTILYPHHNGHQRLLPDDSKAREQYPLYDGLLTYIPETGILEWTLTGKRAGYLNKSLGYWMFSYKKEKMHYQHRLAWEAVNGPIPDGMYVDHINGDRTDNRLSNLRVVEPRQSSANRGMNYRNTSGHKNVDWDKSRLKWRVQLRDLQGRSITKRFDSLEDAIGFRDETARRIHGEYFCER